MKLAKEEQLSYWREHVNQASLHEQGLFGYCQEQKISKSAMYRWKKYFSDLNSNKHIKTKHKIKTQKQHSPFLPVIVESSELKNKTQKQNQPDPAWLAELIVKVIQGLA